MKTVLSTVASTAMMLTAIAQPAAAAFSTSFETPDFTLGSIQGQMGCIASGDASIAAANPHSGSQHLRLVNDTAGCDSYAFTSLTAARGSLYSTSFWFFSNDSDNHFYVYGYDTSGDVSWAMGLIAGNLYIVQNGFFAPPGNVLSVSSGVFHEMRTVYNPGNSTWDYYLDGTLILHQTTGLAPATSTNYAAFRLHHSGGGIVDVDDVTFSSVPSPGGAALLGLGALVAIRRKR